MIFSSSDTISLYGDSISDFKSFNTFNQALYRDLEGKIRFSENAPLIADGSITNGRPGWDLAIAGTPVSTITHRFVDLVGKDEAKIVMVLMGANNYGADGPGTGTPQDWIDRANEIVHAAAVAGKILVFIPPLSHYNDPIVGRDVLRAYLPTLASDTVIVPDTSAFDWHVDTNDGVHPNAIGAELLAQEVMRALAPHLVSNYDFSLIRDHTVNLVSNGDLAGTAGVLVGGSQGYTQGVVADNWALRRVGTTGTVIAEKGIAADGHVTQVIHFDGQGEVRLTQAIALSGHAGEQYEIAVKIKVTDPNHLFQGFRAWDSDKANGLLFTATENPVLANGGTGSYETTLRSAKFTLSSDEQRAIVNLSAYFANHSGATVEIEDVMVRRVEGTPSLTSYVTIGTAGNDHLVADDTGQFLQGLAGDDTLTAGHGNDTLDGGTGKDAMYGGAGNDVYIVDNIGDQIYETASKLLTDSYDLGGSDTVMSSVTYSIASSIAGRQFIENIVLTGAAAINATGNDLANHLMGNSAANVLTGGGGDDWLEGGASNDRLLGGAGNDLLIGGQGTDMLTGGSGADTFQFNVAPTTANRDTVTDFQHGLDLIELDRAAFGALAGTAAGPLDPLLLAIGPAATTPDQHLVYNPVTGILSYDADGAGGLAAIAIARFTNLPVINAADIHLL